MITHLRADERQRDRRRKNEVWLTFEDAGPDPPTDGFGILEIFVEDRLPPGTAVPQLSRHDAEIVTYVREGALAYEDSLGRSGVIHAGEFQRRTSGRGLRHSETNASRTDWAHLFQIWLRPSEMGLEPTHDQKRFSAADRRGELCIVASPDARGESLHIHQSALLYSALLDKGQHVVHELLTGRSAWVHLVQGEITLGDSVLTAGDSARISQERAVSLTAREESEILLLDLGLPGSMATG